MNTESIRKIITWDALVNPEIPTVLPETITLDCENNLEPILQEQFNWLLTTDKKGFPNKRLVSHLKQMIGQKNLNSFYQHLDYTEQNYLRLIYQSPGKKLRDIAEYKHTSTKTIENKLRKIEHKAHAFLNKDEK